MRDALACDVFPQIEFDAADILVIGEVAIDRNGRARRGALVQRVLVDVGLFPEPTQDTSIDPAIGRAEFIRDVDDVETLVVVALEGCRGAKASRPEHRVEVRP